jgi:hypothetical protein
MWTSLLLTVALLTAEAQRPEVLDRVMAVVNSGNMKKVITLSDLRKEREVQAVLGVELPTDEDALKFLIERYLVEDQMIQFSGIEPSEQEIEQRLQEVSNPHGVDPAAVREAAASELKRLKFLELRFGQFIHPTDEELKEYYDTEFVPAARKQGGEPLPFDRAMQLPDIAKRLRDTVTDLKLHQEVDTWLKAIKERSEIEIF